MGHTSSGQAQEGHVVPGPYADRRQKRRSRSGSPHKAVVRNVARHPAAYRPGSKGHPQLDAEPAAGGHDSFIGPTRSRRRTAVATIELGGDESRETGRGAAHGRRQLAVDRLGAEVGAGSQAGPHAAALINASQGVVRRGQAHRHPLHLLAETAHRQEQPAPHLDLGGPGERKARAADGDPQTAGGGMIMRLPSGHLQCRGREAPRSNTCFIAVA